MRTYKRLSLPKNPQECNRRKGGTNCKSFRLVSPSMAIKCTSDMERCPVTRYRRSNITKNRKSR